MTTTLELVDTEPPPDLRVGTQHAWGPTTRFTVCGLQTSKLRSNCSTVWPQMFPADDGRNVCARCYSKLTHGAKEPVRAQG